MKKPYYNIMIMSAFSGFSMLGNQKKKRSMVNVEVVKLNYTDIVSVHYRYSGEVYNNNALRYYGRENSQIGFESAWGTTWWPIRFSFFS